MGSEVLRTSADELYELVRARKKISVEEAAKLLKLPFRTVHALVDFLVEEKIFGIEYKFTTPYVFLSEHHSPFPKIGSQSFQKDLLTKEDFFEKAGKHGLPLQKATELWNKYLNENMQQLKEKFYAKAEAKGMEEGQIRILWEKYLAHLR